jgi:hypothetical protein
MTLKNGKRIKESDEDWRKWIDSLNTQEKEEEVKVVDRKDLNLQHFFDDMNLIGKQINSTSIRKPTFHYGDLSVTNYLLWLLLGEIMILNNKTSEDARTDN